MKEIHIIMVLVFSNAYVSLLSWGNTKYAKQTQNDQINKYV